MAGLAFPAVGTLVLVHVTVTGVTVVRQFLFERITRVAAGAGRGSVLPGQRVIGTPVMVETDLLPGLVVMAVAACRTKATGVHIIETVTVVTELRCTLVALSRMATVAGNIDVLAVQREVGPVMIEIVFLPGLYIMAAIAFPAQIALVHVVLPVAARTFMRCLAEFLPGLVAAGTIRQHMRTLERIVGLFVIKCLATEIQNVRLEAEVVIMAAAALFPADATAPVKTPVVANIPIHLLVAVQTKPALALLAERLMTFTALRLVLRMPLNQLARRDHGFDSSRKSAAVQERAGHKHCHTQQYPVQHGHKLHRNQ